MEPRPELLGPLLRGLPDGDRRLVIDRVKRARREPAVIGPGRPVGPRSEGRS